MKKIKTNASPGLSNKAVLKQSIQERKREYKTARQSPCDFFKFHDQSALSQKH